MRSSLLRSAASCFVAIASASFAAAQCTPEPNTGCPGALPPQCGSPTAIGQQFKVACLNNGRADVQFLLVGLCPSAPLPLPAPLACVTATCNVGVDLGLSAAIDTGFATVVLSIPNNRALVGVNLCLQCAEVIAARPCLTLSQAGRVVIS
jgi:hypothetical protein